MAKASSFGGVGRALSHEYFRRYWLGMMAATTGFWAYRVALGWLVWELTHSPTWLGLVVFAEMVPMVLLQPIGGAIVERHRSLWFARMSQFGWAVTIGSVALATSLGVATKEVLFVLSAFQGVVSAFSNPSHLALVAKLVPKEDLAPAIALQSGVVQTGRFIGPAIAGPILVFSGPELVFWIVCGAFLFFVVMLFCIGTLLPDEPSRSQKSLFGDLVDGVKYATNHFAIRHIILLTAVAALLLRPVAELMPAFADNVFNRGESGLSWLLASFGMGSILSSIWIAFRGSTAGLTRYFATNLMISTVGMAGFGLVTNFWLANIFTLLIGFGANALSIAAQTMIQTIVAGHMRARVMSLLGVTFRGLPALGALLQGVLASAFTLATPIIVGAIFALLLWIYLDYLIRRRGLAEAAEGQSESPS